MTSLLVPLSFALTTLTPFRAHPSDGPKLILKAPASSWECGSETTLWSKETLTKGGVWFPPLSSKWIHTVGACVREFVRVCVCVCSCLFMKPCNTPCCHTLHPIKSHDSNIHNLNSYFCKDRVFQSSDLWTTKETIWSLLCSFVSISQMTRNTCFLVSWEQLLATFCRAGPGWCLMQH